MINSRCLVLDVETSPLIAYTWGRQDQDISVNQVKEDSLVIAFGAKWLGGKKVIYRDLRGGKAGERALLLAVWALLDKADIVVTHNGVKFDNPVLRARFIANGIEEAPRPYRHADTCKIAQTCRFTSSSLEYLSKALKCKFQKLSHPKFPGMELWKECMAGNKAAWAEMKRYNIRDVLATEELFLKLRPWAPASIANVFNAATKDQGCPKCKAVGDMVSNGNGYADGKPYRKYKCLQCGKYSRGA